MIPILSPKEIKKVEKKYLIKSNNKIQNSVSIQLRYQEYIKAITEVLCISQKLTLVL